MADTVQQIKDRLSIVDVVSQYVKLQRAGASLRARCPFHAERTPSFHVSPERGTYHCFGCNVGGDIFSFVEAIEGLDFKGALKVLAERAGVQVHVGFSLRYHRAFREARRIVDSGVLGPLMFLRARYGHGGRIGYNKEWRAKPAISGGGELIDQGIHLIDLARWFLGDFPVVSGYAHTYYWDMPVDDNGFMILKTPKQQVAFLHVSCTEWKNLFSMEIYGRGGKLDISGLGGSYGLERLTHYKMLPEMGPPETTAWEYPMGDDSWAVEMAEFYEDIQLNRAPAAGLGDAYAALRVIEKIYKESGYDHCA